MRLTALRTTMSTHAALHALCLREPACLMAGGLPQHAPAPTRRSPSLYSMDEDPQSLPHFEPELLVATYSVAGEPIYRNEAWHNVLGRNWSRLSDEDQERAAQYLGEAARGSLVTNQFFMVIVPGRDEALPVLLNFLPVHLPTGGGATRIAAISLTGEVLREPDTWTQSQTQRNRLETLGRMTMGIAHDFNNLLSGILGYTELLKSYAAEEIRDATLSEHLRTIERAALDGAALIRKIQQYIRQEKQTHFTPLDIPTLIQDCVSLTRPYWYNEPRRQGISIEVSQDFDDVPPVMGSATELREVFLNLILNAVQAMPEGGTITFRTYDTEEGVCVDVHDDGMGMSGSVRQRIFEPLYTTKGERGTGMGLAVSYGIIQEHEGTIDVDSQLGEGSTFHILLPRAEEARQERRHIIDRRPRKSARVMVVDDETMVRTILDKLLSLKGHTVTQAESGQTALRLAETNDFDLVFTDLGMPEMNGRQLARELRARHPDLPIILLTGDTEAGEPGEEVDEVLSKPFKIDQLEATIQNILRERDRRAGDGAPAER